MSTQDTIPLTVGNSASDRYKYTLTLDLADPPSDEPDGGHHSEDRQVIIADGNASFVGMLLRVLAFIGLGIFTFSFFGERFVGAREKPRD